MISLRFAVEATGARHPFVVRLNDDYGLRSTTHDVYLAEFEGADAVFEGPGGLLRVQGLRSGEADGDVLLVIPDRNIAHRLIRAASDHNTLLVTERCDQLCVMCSQPPKTRHVDMFSLLETAALLAPRDATIGISGGEPTLYKDQLFGLLTRVLEARPDVSFHVLTNAQHFVEQDVQTLRALPAGSVTWGVPLYSADPGLHDRIVGKQGAQAALLNNLAILCRAGAAIELRTVIMRLNVARLTELAVFLVTHVPFVTNWAIMQLENIGYARKNWDELFEDTSISFGHVASALDLARARGISAVLYNFPLCTVPEPYRALAPSTISDWKRRYLSECDDCSARSRCGGFFEWYPDDRGFAGVRHL
ncbi:MAG: His-Xaa-Ser system radical SAM maturase HxsC [Candidatus Kaistia colombiensis]|nr:MAG: His-Xaa-Ser system radical SAM maturase HxsC [Kaistia sp.]